jgi:hypothetical protein
MNQQISTWIVIGFSIFGISAAILAFLRTPKENRGIKAAFRLTHSAEERLKECPAKAEAVIIKGDRRRYITNFAPAFIFLLLMFCINFLASIVEAKECTHLFGKNMALLHLQFLLLQVCFIVPVGFFILSLFTCRMGIKTIRNGYFPPLDSVVLIDTIAKKGIVTLSRGYLLTALPILTASLVYLGNDVYQNMMNDTFYGMTTKTETKCASIIQLP